MAQPKQRKSRRPAHRRSGPLFWAAIIVLLAGMVYVYLQMRNPSQTVEQGVPLAEEELGDVAGERAVVLVFPTWDASGYLVEERQLASRNRLEQDLMMVMAALCEGPTTGRAVLAMPEGTRPLAAFYNESDGSIVLDFSSELVINHPGGSAAEQGTLTAILRTLALNFPEVKRCTLLVDGAQTETLAGHIAMDKPFVPRRWL